MLAAVRSATLVSVDGQPVTVEVHVSPGLPAYAVVGLPDTAVRESRERVRAAVLSSDLPFPMSRITVNLCKVLPRSGALDAGSVGAFCAATVSADQADKC